MKQEKSTRPSPARPAPCRRLILNAFDFPQKSPRRQRSGAFSVDDSQRGDGDRVAAGKPRGLCGEGHGVGLDTLVETVRIEARRQGAKGPHPVMKQPAVTHHITALMGGSTGLKRGIPMDMRAVRKAIDVQRAGIADDFTVGQKDTGLAVTAPRVALHAMLSSHAAFEEQSHDLVVDGIVIARVDTPPIGTFSQLGLNAGWCGA